MDFVEEVCDILDYWIEGCYNVTVGNDGVFLEIDASEIIDDDLEDNVEEAFKELKRDLGVKLHREHGELYKILT